MNVMFLCEVYLQDLCEVHTQFVKGGKYYKVTNKEIKIIWYADDAITIVRSEDNVLGMVHKCKIANLKTQPLVINKEPTKSKIKVDCTSIDQIMEII